jgi:hypothetical protein
VPMALGCKRRSFFIHINDIGDDEAVLAMQ